MWLIDDLKSLKSTDRYQYYFVLLFCAFWCNACFLDFGTVVVDKLLHVVDSRQIIKLILFFFLACAILNPISFKLSFILFHLLAYRRYYDTIL